MLKPTESKEPRGGVLSSPSGTLFCLEGRQEVVRSHLGSKQSSSKWRPAGNPLSASPAD